VRGVDVCDDGKIRRNKARKERDLTRVIGAQLKHAVLGWFSMARSAWETPIWLLLFLSLYAVCAYPVMMRTRSSFVVVFPLLPVMAMKKVGSCNLLNRARSRSACVVSSTRMMVHRFPACPFFTLLTEAPATRLDIRLIDKGMPVEVGAHKRDEELPVADVSRVSRDAVNTCRSTRRAFL